VSSGENDTFDGKPSTVIAGHLSDKLGTGEKTKEVMMMMKMMITRRQIRKSTKKEKKLLVVKMIRWTRGEEE